MFKIGQNSTLLTQQQKHESHVQPVFSSFNFQKKITEELYSIRDLMHKHGALKSQTSLLIDTINTYNRVFLNPKTDAKEKIFKRCEDNDDILFYSMNVPFKKYIEYCKQNGDLQDICAQKILQHRLKAEKTYAEHLDRFIKFLKEKIEQGHVEKINNNIYELIMLFQTKCNQMSKYCKNCEFVDIYRIAQQLKVENQITYIKTQFYQVDNLGFVLLNYHFFYDMYSDYDKIIGDYVSDEEEDLE
ncbi:hypothetical protein AB837_00476 [bacterium AB1]|nr:hypothetical protein AB837_00476 [bacterium AB1]